LKKLGEVLAGKLGLIRAPPPNSSFLPPLVASLSPISFPPFL